MPNPVLQRELTAHLRSPRAFVLQGLFVAALGGVVAAAWPAAEQVDMLNPTSAQRLVELFFIGQFFLASLTAPAFAAGSLTGEKERKSYEMLLASALRPAQIVWGKWAGAFVPSLLLIVSSVPIVMLCLPLGGVSFYEVAVGYMGLLAATAVFSLISLACSAYFARSTAALAVSYLIVLPAALPAVFFWQLLGGGRTASRLWLFGIAVPVIAAVVLWLLFRLIARRLWYPPDVGSEGNEVVDEMEELRRAVGLVLDRDRFPDRLFAPAKRDDLMPDRLNPVLDKELRSELFSQGTLMLRLVIQLSLMLAVPLMGACLFFRPAWASWYVSYVVLFNLLVGPVFSAGSVSGERERRTLDLLLVTTLRPATILWGKLFGGLRVSFVLTMFLTWPMLLACALVPEYYGNLATVALWFLLIVFACLFTSVVSLFCSVSFRKSSVCLAAAYLAIATSYTLAPAADFLTRSYFPQTRAAMIARGATITSPFAAAMNLPLELSWSNAAGREAEWTIYWGHLAFQGTVVLLLLGTMIRIFRNRYDAAG